MTRLITSAFGAGILALALTAGPSGATEALLTPAEVTAKIEAAGYTHVHDLEYDYADRHYEADAVSPAGVAVDLDVDPKDGRILHEKRDS